MTGVCCRCQIRHEENGWLCCRHGVICSDDVGASELTLVALSTFVFGAVLAAATWVGMHGTDVEKLAAGFVLVAVAAPTLAWALRDDSYLAARTGPDTFTSNTEPKEHR